MKRKIVTIIAGVAVVTAGLVALPATAHAETAPTDGTPPSVTSDSLPTAQIDGVVWTQKIVGNTVYAGGSFTKARPAGAAKGTQEVDRTNLIAYDITTGVMTSWAPAINGQVRTIALSPDESTLYIGGDFTLVDGQARYRIAAFDLATKQLTSFAPQPSAAVRGIAVTNSAVYFTGAFGRVNGNDRANAAATTLAGVLLPWAPALAGGSGQAIVASPDGAKIVLGGAFTSVNGSNNPGYGLAILDATTAALLPAPVNAKVRNGGTQAAILSLTSDADSFYGTGYVFGQGGNLEGVFRADWETGSLTWVEDCHGDTYGVAAVGDLIYATGHAHYCGSIVGGFPQSDPWTVYRGLAFTKSVERTTPFGLNLGYFDWGGNPAPRLTHWFPTLDTGPSGQGGWSVAGNSQYVVIGGEFNRANYKVQQGLSRFTVASNAPKKDGPRLTGDTFVPSAVAIGEGKVRISWPLNWDRDNEYLTYQLIRDGQNNSPIYTVTARSKSADWGLPGLSYTDNGLAVGSSHTYRVRVTDPDGNVALSNIITAVADGTGAVTGYSQAVLNDQPINYWPLNDTSPTLSYDWTGASDLRVNAGVTRNTPGALIGVDAPGSTFSGGTNGFAATSNRIEAPQTFGMEAWFKTTTTGGGKILGFGNSSTSNSSSYDRHVYMNPNGTISFGVYPGSSQIITSGSSYNDGQWHQVVAGLSSEGMSLYIDGRRVASRTDVTSAQAYSGYWRVGGDTTWNGNRYLPGSIDEVAIYAAPLTRQQVVAHYVASGRELAGATAPADAYGAAVYAAQPDAYWRLGESSGSVAQDSSGAGMSGAYFGSSSKGAAGALTNVSDTSVLFSGGQVISQTPVDSPRTYSVEAWFKTTSTNGGKIIGFGNSKTGNSTNYDRHVYMRDDGRLVFGTWVGSQATVTTGAAYNDGTWHHVVASQGVDGQKLYVDGQLQGTNPEMNAQAFVGYWHIGGDVTWEGASTYAFDGAIDEVAVYPSVLDANEVLTHYTLGTDGMGPNQLPVASFTANANKLAVSVDASASTDPDGSIASYSWNWGDGTPDGTGVTAAHTYTAAGDFTVTLTVTDDRGGVATKTSTVSAVANAAPTASFTAQVAGMTVSVDGTASSDTDGSVQSFVWSWGDGSPDGTGATATHTYTQEGEYVITLTVADNDGATGTHDETVEALIPTGPVTYATDTFARSVTNGLGTADQGGAWSVSNPVSAFQVDGSAARVSHTTGGSTRSAYLTGVSATDTSVKTEVAFPARPTGGSAYTSIIARRVGSIDYRAVLVTNAAGAVTMHVRQTDTALASRATGITINPGDTLMVRVEAVGTSPTTVRAKVWKSGTTEPTDWLLSATDSTASLQTAGYVGLSTYLAGAATNLPFVTVFDNFVARSSGGEQEPPANVAPVALFNSSIQDRSVTVDASGSYDPDGTIVTYAWTFGDGAVADGVSAAHDYASPGDYTITLTVTDNGSLTSSVTTVVTATDPELPSGSVALDDFSRAVSNGWGAATSGGTWSVSGGPVNFSVADGKGAMSATAGATRTAVLSVTPLTSSDVTDTVTFAELPVGSSVYTSLSARRVGSEDYAGQVVLSAAGTVQLQILRSSTKLAAVGVGGLAVAPGESLVVRVQAIGTNPTTVSAKVWKAGTPEPADWMLTVTDSTPSLQTAGVVGVGMYLGGSVSNTPYVLRFDDLVVNNP